MSRIKSFVAGLLFLCTAVVCAQTSPPKKVVSSPLQYKLSVPFNTPWSIDVDRYGRLYILDNGRHTIMRFGLSGELEGSWSTNMHEAQAAFGRKSVAVTPEGSIFAGTAHLERNIKRFTPYGETTLPLSEGQDGTVIAASEDGSYITLVPDFDKQGDERRIVATRVQKHDPDGKAVANVTFPADARITIGPDELIYLVDAEETQVIVYGINGSVIRKIKLQSRVGDVKLLHPYMQVDSNGDIYLASSGNVTRYNKNGLSISSWNPSGEPRGGILYPGAFRVRNGLIYFVLNFRVRVEAKETSDTSEVENSSEIRVYTPDGQWVARYIPARPETNTPASIAVGEDGSYVVVEHGNHGIYFYGPTGRKIVRLPRISQAGPNLVVARPGGGFFIGVLELDSKGNFVADHYENDSEKEPSTESSERTISRRGATRANSDRPIEAAVDPVSKNIWTMSRYGTLACYSPEGKIQNGLGTRQNPKLRVGTSPMGMAVDHQGYIYLPFPLKHKILKLDQTGNIVATIGKEGSGFGELRFPEGIAIDDQDHIFVADCENNRIQVFSTDGTPLAVWGKRGNGEGELCRPFNVTIAPGNVLWIADTFNDRIVKLTLPRFWEEASRKVELPAVAEVRKRKPIPVPGLVTVEGIVVAGSDDLRDVVYVESPDREWGTKVTLPKDSVARRGRTVKVTGTLELVERAAKHLKAITAKVTDDRITKMAPLGMSNIYVGDGYTSGNKQLDISNLGLLIRTWGKVISVDRAKNIMIINDGSYTEGEGLVVYAGDLTRPLTTWPEVGQYLCITGISITWASTDGKFTPGLRVRDDDDIEVLK